MLGAWNASRNRHLPARRNRSLEKPSGTVTFSARRKGRWWPVLVARVWRLHTTFPRCPQEMQKKEQMKGRPFTRSPTVVSVVAQLVCWKKLISSERWISGYEWGLGSMDPQPRVSPTSLFLNFNTFSSVLFWQLNWLTGWVVNGFEPCFGFFVLSPYCMGFFCCCWCVCLSVVSAHLFSGTGHAWLGWRRVLGVFLFCMFSTSGNSLIKFEFTI